MLIFINEQLSNIPPEQRPDQLLAAMVGICNAFALPMSGMTMQPNKEVSIDPAVVTQLAATIQNKSAPKVNHQEAYYGYYFPQISSSSSAVVFYKNKKTGQLCLLLTEHKLYKSSYLLPCGYRDVMPPYISPNIDPKADAEQKTPLHVGRVKKNKEGQSIGWQQSFLGKGLISAGEQAIAEMASNAGGFAKLNLEKIEEYRAQLKQKGIELKGVDENSVATCLRELREETGVDVHQHHQNIGYFMQAIPTADMPAGANPGRSQHDERPYVIYLGEYAEPPAITHELDADKLTAAVHWIPVTSMNISKDTFTVPAKEGAYYPIALGHRHLIEQGLKIYWNDQIQQTTLNKYGYALVSDVKHLVAQLEPLALDGFSLWSVKNCNIKFLINELTKSFDENNEFFTYTNMQLLEAAKIAAHCCSQVMSGDATYDEFRLNATLDSILKQLSHIHEEKGTISSEVRLIIFDRSV